jgi:hypothetical protein
VEAHCRLHRGQDLSAFDAFEIGVENKTLLVETLEQHHADVRHAVLVHGRQRDGAGVVRLAFHRIVEPFGKEPERLRSLGEVTAC